MWEATDLMKWQAFMDLLQPHDYYMAYGAEVW